MAVEPEEQFFDRPCDACNGTGEVDYGQYLGVGDCSDCGGSGSQVFGLEDATNEEVDARIDEYKQKLARTKATIGSLLSRKTQIYAKEIEELYKNLGPEHHKIGRVNPVTGKFEELT